MSDEAIKIEISGNIKADIAVRIRDIAKAAIEADTNLSTLKRELAGFSASSAIRQAATDTRELRTEITRVTATQKAFAASNQKATDSLLTAGRAADRYGQSLRNASVANSGMAKSASALGSVLATAGGYLASFFAIQKYAQAQDALTNIQNKVRSLTTDLGRQSDIQDALFDVANRTRSSVEATTDGFTRFAKAMNGASDTEVLRFVETLNKQLISAGRTTGEVTSIVTQLGQALTSGKLMGDEFRSLSENLPREALQAIADVLGTTVEQLKGLSSQGAITTEVLRVAFQNLAASTDATFARTIPTIGQALTVLNNQFIAFTSTSSAQSEMLANSIMFIGNNLKYIIPAIYGFAGAWAAVQLVKIVADIFSVAGALIKLAATFVAVNAIMIIWVGIVALVGAALLSIAYTIAVLTGNAEAFEKSIADAIIKVKDYAGGMLEAIGGSEALSAATESLSGNLGTMQSNMENSGTAATEAGDKYRQLIAQLDQTDVAANDVYQSMAEIGPAASASALEAEMALTKMGNSAKSEFEKAENATSAWEASLNGLINTLQSVWEAAVRAANAVAGALGFGDGSTPSTPTKADNAGGDRSPGFRQGGSFTVGGQGGEDAVPVRFNAQRGERVDVLTPADQRNEGRRGYTDNSRNVSVTIMANDADSFNNRRSRQQVQDLFDSVVNA